MLTISLGTNCSELLTPPPIQTPAFGGLPTARVRATPLADAGFQGQRLELDDALQRVEFRVFV